MSGLDAPILPIGARLFVDGVAFVSCAGALLHTRAHDKMVYSA